jgi:hypothetical protein
MNKWKVTRINQYGTPKLETIEIIGFDINEAVSNTTKYGWMIGDIVSIKLKGVK